MRAMELKDRLAEGKLNTALAGLYGDARLEEMRARISACVDGFEEHFGTGREVMLFSAPGRSELGGNHTDHNNGLVLAAAVDLDIIAVVGASDVPVVRVASQGFDKVDEVWLDDTAPRVEEEGHSVALLRGLCEKLAPGQARGFDTYTISSVLKGSGLSSSAAFEVCLAGIMDSLYGLNKTPIQLARAGQYAENDYFGKPSGLMDQAACAVGGVAFMDFESTEAPRVEKLELDLARHGYALVVCDTKGSHAGLTEEYAAIRREMELVADCFGQRVLRQVAPEAFFGDISRVRNRAGDRAVLRATHFFEECRRVEQMVQAILQDDMAAYLRLVLESGHSSVEYLQNAHVVADPTHQGIPLALALTQRMLAGRGAWRLQGGGFAGTIQAYVPLDGLAAYIDNMQNVFGANTCYTLQFRNAGCVRVAG